MGRDVPAGAARQLDDGHRAFRDAAGAAVIGGHELEPARDRDHPAHRPGRSLTTTDGPFLETKEALGGYYLLEAADLDEVIALAARLHEVSAGHSGVEIRPVVERRMSAEVVAAVARRTAATGPGCSPPPRI